MNEKDIDPVILLFVSKMIEQLNKNDYRGDFKDVGDEICIDGIKRNIKELGEYPYNMTAIVDIANFALMLAIGRHLVAYPKPVNGGLNEK